MASLKVLIVLLILSVSSLAYTDNGKEQWQKIDADGKFTFYIPPDMREATVQGIDSYVGEFESACLILTFDDGWWSDNLNYSQKPEYKEAILTVDNKKAKLVTFDDENTSNQYKYVLAVNFYGLGIKNETLGTTKLTIWTNCKNLSDYAIAEKIIKSIQFPDN